MPSLFNQINKPLRSLDPSRNVLLLNRVQQQAKARPDVVNVVGFLRRRAPPGAAIGLVGGEETLDYPLFGPRLGRRVVRFAEAEEVTYARMRRERLAGVLLSDAGTPPRTMHAVKVHSAALTGFPPLAPNPATGRAGHAPRLRGPTSLHRAPRVRLPARRERLQHGSIEPMADTPVHHDLIYDVGMHRGEDTAFYLAKGFRVVAFEANPDLVALSQRRFDAEIESGRLHIVSGAIVAPNSDEQAVRFYRHPERSEWGTMDQAWGRSHGLPIGEFEMVEVEPIDFARCVRECGVPHYMKIDVEGIDKACLETLHSFANRPMYASLESERHDFEVLEREVDLLESLGYDRFMPVQQAGMDQKQILTQDLGGAPLRYRFEPHSSGPFGEDLSGDWLTKPQVLERYAPIFRAYRFWANQSLVAHTRVGRQVRRLASTFLNRPLPGWYDTHAKHSTAC